MRRLKPRMETLLSLGFISAMSIPGTRRRISGMVAAPLIRISSSPMMVSEAGARVSELERAEAVTTCSSKMSSASASCVEESSAAISRAVARVLAEMVSASNMSSSGWAGGAGFCASDFFPADACFDPAAAFGSMACCWLTSAWSCAISFCTSAFCSGACGAAGAEAPGPIAACRRCMTLST